jgi:hypothetical protein
MPEKFTGLESEQQDLPPLPRKLSKALARLKLKHWLCLREVRDTAEGAILPHWMGLYLGKLVRLGLVDLIENPGFHADYQITEEGRNALAAREASR